MKKKFFLTTSNKAGLTKFLLLTSFKNAKLNLNENKIKKIIYFPIPDLKFLFSNINNLFYGLTFNKKKLIDIKFLNSKVGIYIINDTYKKKSSYKSKLFFNLNFLISFIKVACKIFSIKFYYHFYNFDYIFIDHANYLNGCFLKYLKIKKKIIYTTAYPRHIFKILPKDNYPEERRVKFFNNNLSRNQTRLVLNIRKKIFKKNSHLYHVRNIKFKKINKSKYENLERYEYIIYCHSFFDLPLNYGFDGFINMLEWLKFTIEYLASQNKKIIIKAHPNFYNPQSKYAMWDKEIFEKKILSKFEINKNILIINEQYNNLKLIKKLSKNCVAITHHGSVFLEMAHNKFKVISSKYNLYNNTYKISNNWGSIAEYKKLLNFNTKNLKKTNYNHFNKLIHNLFCNKDYFYSENSYYNYLRKIINPKQDLTKKKIEEIFKKKDLLSIEKIAKNYYF